MKLYSASTKVFNAQHEHTSDSIVVTRSRVSMMSTKRFGRCTAMLRFQLMTMPSVVSLLSSVRDCLHKLSPGPFLLSYLVFNARH